ncbi:putative chromatin remodeling & transcription regulator BTB-POZ family [Helianthus annuus]|uniref:Chromatin remodeling & transcription regulator BTB-POZ family n=2 Tax=Helianthus annuus TaxID=4232 RepID=A0A9K3HSK1_HELAN|nr:putative chromatin remodeling & transcription regulator BTB-POZ family [Helianthus annuus]KAJ0503136.1 putative chromatin remodeling & transcription regulator BTB-POZ family [Helianthus annuus]KAJ0511390.1 putative chromatin remodeling & transcription regulator BTB-POZ family [Helianthus annuus]KAJ0519104.1 putative chromatin remodeling & transcription regulator BTB-POZ family [Helianthus annuus]KAJ0687096.1 putative chromatin remodeling & transcription regulator BTB-POZ family [Helianthus a
MGGLIKSLSLYFSGKKFCTTVETLTHREPRSMLAAMFSGRHTLCKDSEKGYVFIDRDGKHFRHILNWLRDGVAPIRNLSDLERVELLREAEYYQLLGLVDMINEVLNKKDEQMDTDLTRTDIIKIVQYAASGCVSLIGVNLSGLDLSKLCLKGVDFSFASLNKVIFSGANLHHAQFQGADAENTNFQNATLTDCEFTKANLRGALLAGANLRSANLHCSELCDADLRSARLENARFTYANLEGANLEGANLTGAKMRKANLKGANLQRACLVGVDLQDTVSNFDS